jgi:hypothetical protein
MMPKSVPESSKYDSPENAKQMAVQKTLDLIKSFKKEETQQAAQQQQEQEVAHEDFHPAPVIMHKDHNQSASDYAV